MTDRAALLAALSANPDEDTVRLGYADWLDENDHHDRAEFIRLQIEIARLGPLHKKPSYPEQPQPLKALGDRHYEFTGYPEDGFAVGDRIDLLVQRPLKSSKMVHGFRIYKIEPDRLLNNRGELKVYVRLDAGSGPWKGTELKKREEGLLAAHRDEWLRVECRAIGPHHGDACDGGRVQSPNAQFMQHCKWCEGTGDIGRLSEITVHPWDAYDNPFEVLTFPVTFARGFPFSIAARLADVFERPHYNPGHDTEAYGPWQPTALALRWLRHHPTIREVTLTEYPSVLHVIGKWGFTTTDLMSLPPAVRARVDPDQYDTAEIAARMLARSVADVIRTHLEKESERDD